MQEIFIRREDDFLHIAHISDGILSRLEAGDFAQKGHSDLTERGDLAGRIYLGRVERVVPHLQAAFVDIGLPRAGFLGAREARVLVPEATIDTPIEVCVQDGDVVLVQITRPPSEEKGAQITADITLPGHALVLAPCRDHIAISRTIEDETTRNRLKEIVESADIPVEGIDGAAGWVVRTAAATLRDAELTTDMAQLANTWQGIIEQAADTTPPLLLHADVGLLERTLRDVVRDITQINAIVIDDAQVYEQGRNYCTTQLSDIGDSVCALLQKSEAGEHLFDRHDIETQLTNALSPRLELPSGGWLMIETTQAMTTIDVNSGAHNAPAAQVNAEAALTIIQHIGLRRLGGLIAIDFIDMTDPDECQEIETLMHTAFDNDRQVRLGTLSEFCVLELTRRREAKTLQQMMADSALSYD
ncbi:MAG: hypothetical protein HAW64_04435 [Alphaproteobacteria bacterium]|nr:hypothetical protein [Alphaproteobacteria bacterium]